MTQISCRVSLPRLEEGRVHNPAVSGELLSVELLLVPAVLALGPGTHKVGRNGEVDDTWCEYSALSVILTSNVTAGDDDKTEDTHRLEKVVGTYDPLEAKARRVLPGSTGGSANRCLVEMGVEVEELIDLGSEVYWTTSILTHDNESRPAVDPRLGVEDRVGQCSGTVGRAVKGAADQEASDAPVVGAAAVSGSSSDLTHLRMTNVSGTEGREKECTNMDSSSRFTKCATMRLRTVLKLACAWFQRTSA